MYSASEINRITKEYADLHKTVKGMVHTRLMDQHLIHYFTIESIYMDDNLENTMVVEIDYHGPYSGSETLMFEV